MSVEAVKPKKAKPVRDLPTALSDRDFVEAWETSKSTEELESRTSRDLSSCKARAKRLRGLGVNLREIGTKKTVDVAKLNELIAQLH